MTLLYIALFAIALLAALFLLQPIYRSAELAPSLKHRLLLAVALLMLPGTLGLYSVVGSPRIVEVLDERSVTIARANQQVDSLTAQANANPGDGELWAKLGMALLEADRASEAVETLRRAVIASKGNAPIILLFAKAQMAKANGKITDEAKKALDMVLMQDESHMEARYLSALYYIDKGENEPARALLDGLLLDLPEGIPLTAKIKALRAKIN